MNKKSIALGIVIFIVIVLALTLDSRAAPKKEPRKAEPQEQPKMGGTLVFGVGKEPGNPNPFVDTSSTNQLVKDAAYESLLTLDYNDNVVPHLAEAYEVSSGGTEITLHLRKGVKFHNGKEMKAEDVVWSTNHVRDPRSGAYGNNLIQDLKSVDKIGDYTVKFTLFKPSVTFLSGLATICMVPIVPANSLQAGQLKLEKNAFVPGTGPFMYESIQSGFDTVLKKSPEYWGTSYLDKIIFRPIADGANRFNALRTGDVQIADRIAPLDVARVRKGDIRGLVILEEPLGGFRHLIFNWRNPLFQKIEMRQALSYLTDKQRLIDEVYFGAARKADFIMDPNGIWGKAANLPPHKHDLAKAKALLKAAGYKGQVLVMPGRKTTATLLESYQRILGEAGIKVKIEILEAGVEDERVREGKYDLYVDGTTPGSDPVASMKTEYYTSKVDKGRYGNPKVDQLLDNLDQEFNEKKRLQIFKDLAWTMYNYAGDVPLFFEIRYAAMSEKVRGYGPPKGNNNYKTSRGNYFRHVWLK